MVTDKRSVPPGWADRRATRAIGIAWTDRRPDNPVGPGWRRGDPRLRRRPDHAATAPRQDCRASWGSTGAGRGWRRRAVRRGPGPARLHESPSAASPPSVWRCVLRRAPDRGQGCPRHATAAGPIPRCGADRGDSRVRLGEAGGLGSPWPGSAAAPAQPLWLFASCYLVTAWPPSARRARRPTYAGREGDPRPTAGHSPGKGSAPRVRNSLRGGWLPGARGGYSPWRPIPRRVAR